MAKAEGHSFEFVDESHINPGFLEVFDFDSPDQYIKTETDEFSAVCPFSGLPDVAYVKIEYYPTGGKCVELKSLKYYLSVSVMWASIRKQPPNESIMILKRL